MRVSVLASILLAVGCGGSGSPTASAPVPPVSLPDGNYQLAVYSSGFNCVMATYGSGGTPGQLRQNSRRRRARRRSLAGRLPRQRRRILDHDPRAH